MNILFISHLSTNISAGPNWSVPAGIMAQEAIDNCLWIDINNLEMPHWHNVKCFHKLLEFGNRLRLSILPIPFMQPDVVIFEGFYEPREAIFARELYRNHIPYIIIPRGSLTHQALTNHSRFKKTIAHVLLFDRFVHNASAIQYLTNNEYSDSGDNWNKTHYILPNGICPTILQRNDFCRSGINATFIGRIDIYHKGLDILIDACEVIQTELRQASFQLALYGPKKYQYQQVDQIIHEKGLQDIISLKGEISGKAKEDILLSSDLFVLTSRFEGHPMGLIEALSYGIPALVTPGSNMLSEIHESNAGWTCDDLTVPKVAESLLELINQRELFCMKGENAKKLSLCYDWKVLASRFHSTVIKMICSK